MNLDSQDSVSTTTATTGVNNQPAKTTATTRYRSFGRYFRILQKQIHPSCKISNSAITALDSMIASLFTRIAIEARTLAQKQKRPTLLVRDIEFACKLVLPQELHNDALSAGKTAVIKYQDTLKRDRSS